MMRVCMKGDRTECFVVNIILYRRKLWMGKLYIQIHYVQTILNAAATAPSKQLFYTQF